MLQSAITRIGTNYFTLKALSAAFVSATFAIIASSTKPSMIYAAFSTLPVFIFWLMDAQYIKLEKSYRAKYEKVRIEQADNPYCMNPEEFLADVPGVIKIAFTWSACWYYFALILVPAVFISYLANCINY